VNNLAKNQPAHLLIIAGLLGLLAALPWWLYINAPFLGIAWSVLTGVAVPAALLFAVVMRTRNWSGITALCMIPFASIGVMEIVANLRRFDSGMLIALLSIAVFIAALYAGRREAHDA
jgi:hypothetical protein